MKLVVTLGAPLGASFDIFLYETNFVKKYIIELEWCLQNCGFNQTEAFASFFSTNACNERILNSCATINKYLKNFIEIREFFSQEYYNYLHTKFEQLSGEFDRPTRLFANANAELKQAIRDLNFFVHRAEVNQDPYPSLYVSFNKYQYRRQKLSDEDYKEFEFKFPAGTLFLQYAELGKEYLDLYQDGLPIDYPGAKNLHYYSGESCLTFEEFDCFADDKYINWLKSNNIDPFDKTLGHGRIPIGYVKDKSRVIKLLDQYRYLENIKIEYE